MNVLLIGNLSDTRCGFQNFTAQMRTALPRAGVHLNTFDGTYTQVYARQQRPDTPYLGMFPPDVLNFDGVHLVWNAMTMNHYSGAPWQLLIDAGVVTSWWDGGPSDASCPFIDFLQVRWSDYPRDGYHYMPYPVPDWVEDLPPANEKFTIGASSVRGDGIAEIRQVAETLGCELNLPAPGQWLSVEDEIRRLARSTVNICWYNTPPLWHNRASAPSMLLAALRPVLVNEDPLVAHLREYTPLDGVYHGRRSETPTMLDCVAGLQQLHASGVLALPARPYVELGWHRCAAEFRAVWERERYVQQRRVREAQP